MEKNSHASLTSFNDMIIAGDINSKAEINKWFDQLVVKGDYHKSLRDDVLEYCYNLLKKYV